MVSKSRSRSQVKKDKIAQRKLRSTGLFKGKIDLRKPPTASQKRALKKYADVIAGRAKVLTPKNPKSYKGVFRVVGDKVIVPRRRGQRVKVSKSGEIEVARNVGGKMQRGKFRKLAEITTGKGKVYLLPLARHDGIEWMKFDSLEEMNKFVFETSPKIGATYKNFASYVLEMSAVTYEQHDEGGDIDEYLDERLLRKIRRRRRARKSISQ